MTSLKLLLIREARPVIVHSRALEVIQAITQYSARKRFGGQEALSQSVSFSFLDELTAPKPGSFFQRLGIKSKSVETGSVAWLVGYLRPEGTTRLYVNRNGRGYLATTRHTLRVPGDVWLLTDERLEQMTLSQLEDIRRLLRTVKK